MGERAQIIAISLDESRAPAQQMVQARGWDALALHLWAGADAFGSPIAQAFGVNSIPSYVLIDPDGKVAHNEALASTAHEEMFELLLLLASGQTQ